jgi:transposase
LRPLYGVIETHVPAAGRLHGDDTPVPILAKSLSDVILFSDRAFVP